MKISVVVATNRDTYWKTFCASLAQNSVPLEVIFVGPVGVGVEGLPVPVRFIDIPDTGIGAARCWEIGARAGTGDLLCLAADDCVYTPGFLDAVVVAASLPHNPFDMFTAKYMEGELDSFHAQRMWCVKEMPTLPVGGVTFAEDYHRIGGVDKRFHAVLFDADLYMSMYALGGRTTLLEGHTCCEQNMNHALFAQNQHQDGEVLRSFWPEPLSPDMKRVGPRLRWEDDLC